MPAVMSITFFFVADVKCSLYDINKNNRANPTHGPSTVQKMFRDGSETMLDWRAPGPGPGPVLTLTTSHCQCCEAIAMSLNFVNGYVSNNMAPTVCYYLNSQLVDLAKYGP